MTSKHRATTAITALTCGAALLAMAACTGAAAADDPDGGEGDLAKKSAQQISDDALHELLGATSLRLRTQTSGDPTKLDLSLDRDSNCAGSISKGPAGRVELIKRGPQVWMKPDAAFWKGQLPGSEGSDAAKQYEGRYLHGTTDDTFLKQLSGACDLSAFQKQIAGPSERPSGSPSPSASAPALTKGKPTVHEGSRVLPIVKKSGPITQTLYVAIEGKHYPLKLTAAADQQTGTILLSNYGAPVPDKTPAPGDTLDISVLENRVKKASPGSPSDEAAVTG